MKRRLFFLSVFFSFLPALALGFQDCFNREYPREDQDFLKDKDKLEALEAFEKELENNKDGRLLNKRWPTVNLKLTPEEEKSRFGTTGLEQAQKSYMFFHFEGELGTRCALGMMRIVRKMGERKLACYRVESNPLVAKEYLDPAYPQEKKEGMDWKLMMHWIHPPDIKGMSVLMFSYNNKNRDQDVWVWFPSLRKTRRLTPSNGDDSLAGTYKTYAEVFLRRVTDEKHQIIGETVMKRAFLPIDFMEQLHLVNELGPLTKKHNIFMKAIAQPRDCWIIRSTSVKGGYCDYYHTRIWTIDKEWGYGPILEEMYDKRQGRMMSSHLWFWRRSSSYDGRLIPGWYNFAEDLDFEEHGTSYWLGVINHGYPSLEEWFTLRELKKSITTEYIPSMASLPPKKLVPLEALFPTKELQEANRRFFPQRITAFPGPDPTIPVGLEKLRKWE
ncbi:MAG: outer membrane lipoprotein-sorting protein [Thermodesulfobacteriota bacterium]|nr:outer membrane lipoprotein-sorting protein [Thermodesulfobacteriota bacterium]